MTQDTHYNEMIAAIRFRGELAKKFLPEGVGLEWGALYWPTPLTENHKVSYGDFRTNEESQAHYGDKAPPQDQSKGFVELTHVGEFNHIMNKLREANNFFIANHVFEHFPDPVSFLVQVEQSLAEDGAAMISVPDADKIFDKNRNSSTFADLFKRPSDFLYDHIVLTEGLSEPTRVRERHKEIIEKKEDPHLWVFRQTTFCPFIEQILEAFKIRLSISTYTYNPHFNEMIVILQK